MCEGVLLDPFWLQLRNSLQQKGFDDPALPILIKIIQVCSGASHECSYRQRDSSDSSHSFSLTVTEGGTDAKGCDTTQTKSAQQTVDCPSVLIQAICLQLTG